MKEIILTIMTSGVLSAVIGAIVSGLQSRNSVKQGLRQLLYFNIKHDCLSALQAGYIDNASLEAIHESWEIYHNELGGNGYLDNLMDRVTRLEIR